MTDCAVIDCTNPKFPYSPYCKEHTDPEDLLSCKAMLLYEKIDTNKELYERELGGLIEGERRGKKATVSVDVLMMALLKQIQDLQQDYALSDPCWVGRAKKDLADIRNVAGILFVVLDGVSLDLEKLSSITSFVTSGENKREE